MTVDTWAKNCVSTGDLNSISRIISILGDAFKRTGQQCSSERQLLHDLHRQHLISLLKNNCRSHFDEIISLLLGLTDAEALDPAVWMDIVNQHFQNDFEKIDHKEMSQAKLEESCRQFLKSQNLLDAEETEIIHQMFLKHFSKERRSVGLHGLYSKYRAYTVPLAIFQGLLCSSMILHKTEDADDVQEPFEWILNLFQPWIIPLMEDQRQETAAWIQQFAESNKVLFPWSPGDVTSGEIMLKAFTTCTQLIDEKIESERGVMPHLLETYCTRFARPAIKDFVLHPIHVQWQNLPWDNFSPVASDLARLVALLDAFIPLCHEFVGKIIYRFPWRTIFQCDQTSRILAPYFIHIVVKLSAEPQVRQSGNLMKLISQDVPNEMWKWVNKGVFDNLMHWYVMSVDAKVILIEGSHPLDVKILSILRSASQIDDENTDKNLTFDKSKTFLRCMVRLLSSCGSKHKNYIAQHENELEKSMRELVDDLGDLVISCHQNHYKDCQDLMKGFLTLMNSNSVMPRHALQSISDCWLRLTDLPTALLFLPTLLSQASKMVNSPDLVADLLEDCLEAYFQDRGDFQISSDFSASWNEIMPHVVLPQDKDKLTQCLEHGVAEGYGLLLYASLQCTRKQCTSMADEQTRLITTLLDWFRHMRVSGKSEPKLPLLFREMIDLSLRQLDCGAGEPLVAKMLLDFIDVITPLLGLSGQSWSILGVLGFSSKYNPPPRAKFLALSLTYFLQSCILTGPRLKTKT